MTYTPPFLPEDHTDDENLLDRVALARRAREEAAARIERAYADLEPETRKWRTEEPLNLPTGPLRVR